MLMVNNLSFDELRYIFFFAGKFTNKLSKKHQYKVNNQGHFIKNDGLAQALYRTWRQFSRM